MTDNEIKLFMATCVIRVNNLSERIIFIEDQLTRLVNILGKSNIKSPNRADNDSADNTSNHE